MTEIPRWAVGDPEKGQRPGGGETGRDPQRAEMEAQKKEAGGRERRQLEAVARLARLWEVPFMTVINSPSCAFTLPLMEIKPTGPRAGRGQQSGAGAAGPAVRHSSTS